MEELKIDGHKLIYHIPRLYRWHEGKDIYPIYIEVGLHGGCNHRCLFCSFDFLNYKPVILPLDAIEDFISQAATKGVKSILYSGEGEPLLHPNINEIVRLTKNSNIDVALSTNGINFSREKAENLLPFLSWVRFSISAGTRKSYALVHRAKESDFDLAIANIREAVKIKNRHKLRCTIGVQFLLIPQNEKDIFSLISILGDFGVDYLVVKPYSSHPSSKKKLNFILKNKNLDIVKKKIFDVSRGRVNIIFRQNSISKIKKKKPYGHCLGIPFIAHIAANGEVYPCNNFVGNKNFSFGNISTQNFEDIWQGEKRKSIIEMIEERWNVNKCRESCRIDEINCYLWEIRNPGDHVNFI